MKRRLACVLAAAVCLALAAPAAPALAVTLTASGEQAEQAQQAEQADPADPADPADSADSNGRSADRRRQAALTALTGAGAVSAIAEVRDRGGVWRGASGVADTATGAPVRADGRFRAGSVTKMFVATTVLQLAGEGRLGLDDTVEQRLPGLVPNGAGITVRQLLNHTSGLWDPTNESGGIFPELFDPAVFRAWVADGGLRRTVTAQQLVAASAAHPPYFPPGSEWRYSNVNYTLLGMIIERTTGRGYGQEITRRLLRPLGMDHSLFPGTATAIPGPHAHGYWTIVEEAGAVRTTDVDVTEHNPSWAGAAGELISTTDDLLRFERALVTGRLLPPWLMRELTSMVPTEPGAHQLDYGLGLARFQLSCGPVLGHNGGIFGFDTQLWGTADRQVALSYTGRGDGPEQMAQLAAMQGFLEAAFCGGR
ncbi:serine hydrolase domain-containing protein [Kitasatospora sp. NPDC058170]|uniref:serine hydrolase domain-containing protein n=1 Tax=Kitasatospora sp. NPDC058170 TaxID=3346364 RepID=UPI0036D7DDD8